MIAVPVQAGNYAPSSVTKAKLPCFDEQQAICDQPAIGYAAKQLPPCGLE
jgi:hypothetical protein